MTLASVPSATFQMRIVRSEPADTSCLLSGVNVNAHTSDTWPVSTLSSRPVARSQMRIERSALPDAISLPSGLTAVTSTSARVAVASRPLLADELPDLDRLVDAGGDQVVAVGREVDGADPVEVAAE